MTNQPETVCEMCGHRALASDGTAIHICENSGHGYHGDDYCLTCDSNAVSKEQSIAARHPFVPLNTVGAPPPVATADSGPHEVCCPAGMPPMDEGDQHLCSVTGTLSPVVYKRPPVAPAPDRPAEIRAPAAAVGGEPDERVSVCWCGRPLSDERYSDVVIYTAVHDQEKPYSHVPRAVAAPADLRDENAPMTTRDERTSIRLSIAEWEALLRGEKVTIIHPPLTIEPPEYEGST